MNTKLTAIFALTLGLGCLTNGQETATRQQDAHPNKEIIRDLAAAPANSVQKTETSRQRESKIQIAILLDNSGSMNGLIHQARTYLWQVVSDCALAKKNGLKPKFEVALYHYGDSRLSNESGYIKQLAPLSDDLDLISEKLFALTTCGGSEYCGEVIQKAVNELAWSKDATDPKMIFIAGNEPFDQGSVPYRDAVKQAIEKGIIVNTILCADNWGSNDGWKEAALLADGECLILDQNSAVQNIKTPFDQQIAQLNSSINQTYVTYGKRGDALKLRQTLQDQNTSASSVAFTARSKMKASANYRNSQWDLVDAVKDSIVDLDKIKEDELPEPLKKLTPAERKAYIGKKQQEREKIQVELNALLKKQQDFIQEELKKNQTANQKSDLGVLLINSTRKQAEKLGITYKEQK